MRTTDEPFVSLDAQTVTRSNERRRIFISPLKQLGLWRHGPPGLATGGLTSIMREKAQADQGNCVPDCAFTCPMSEELIAPFAFTSVRKLDPLTGGPIVPWLPYIR